MVTSYAFSNLGINGWLVSYFLEFMVLTAAQGHLRSQGSPVLTLYEVSC